MATSEVILDLITPPHLLLAVDLSLREVTEPSVNLSLDELDILLVMCEIVLGGGMMEEEDAVDTVSFARPLTRHFLIPVALGATNLGGVMMIILTSLYQIHKTPNLAQMSSQ